MHPVLFELGPITVRSYGVCVALAFLTGFTLLHIETVRKNFYPEKILDLNLLILVSGIIGARALHVIVNFDFYSQNPLGMLAVWRGGLAFYGGLIVAIFVSLWFLLRNGIPVLAAADFYAPYVALGQAIGRIGCFLNGCCYGKPVAAGYPGVFFPGESFARYPTQVYASLALLLIFFALSLARRKKFFPGFVMGLYLLLYSAQRFIIDFLRGDNPTYIYGLTVSQIISIFVFILTALLLFIIHAKTKVHGRR